MITSPESVLRSPAYRTIPHFRRRLQSAVDAHFLSPLVRQDAIIALHLVVECALGKDAALGPYLDVLPHDVVPRLDTFDDDELEALGDEDLAYLARDSRRRLTLFWNHRRHGDAANNAGSEVQDLAVAMIR